MLLVESFCRFFIDVN